MAGSFIDLAPTFIKWGPTNIKKSGRLISSKFFLWMALALPWASFCYFRSFQTQILQKKIVGISGIRTRIVRVEGEHADHLSTTTARHVVMGRTTAVDLYHFRFYYASRSMWPDVGIKSSQVFPKTCPKRGHSMFLLKMWPFQNYSESLQIFGPLLFATKNFQKFSHTGHGQPKTLFKMFAVTFVIFSRDES